MLEKGDFKSEESLRDLPSTLRPRNSVAKAQIRKIFQAHSVQTGGIICGEIKLAITLRMLAGGSYLDLGLIFGTGYSYPYVIFCQVIFEWICNDKLDKIYKWYRLLQG